jgi:hypothetical protein
MPEVITNSRTSRSCEDVIACAREFFATENWRQTSQRSQVVTFRGKPHVPWYVLVLIAAGLLAYVVPGVVIYLLYVQTGGRFTSVAVTATPVGGGTEVVLRHTQAARGVAHRFVGQLPPLEARARPRHATETLPGLQLRLTGSGPA